MYQLPYGDGYLQFRLPEENKVSILKPKFEKDGPPEKELVVEALNNNLNNRLPPAIIRDGEIAIVVSDLTRPVPNRILLKPLLKKLENRGVKPDQILILVATGMHRVHEKEDLQQLIGEDIYSRYRVKSHDGKDRNQHTYLGKTSRDTPIYIDSDFVEADFKIITGLIDPHQFVGFTGGMKSVTIGLGYKETIEHNHSLMFNKKARLGRKDNPARQDINEARNFLNINFCLNVIVDTGNRIIKVVAGEEAAAWQQGVDFLKDRVRIGLEQPADVVLASPGGYPKDINLYQAQKGLFHADEIVKDGGTIILTAECREGLGSQAFLHWMEQGGGPEEVIDRFQVKGFKLGPHKAYLLSSTLQKSRVILVSDKLSPKLGQRLKLEIVPELEQALTQIISSSDTVAILPKASSMIPVLENKD